ncbi:MAG TPA: SseB family protein [Jiangellaceae bacterium]|nr:SseB family protein [Jiangellaceae bacterium]
MTAEQRTGKALFSSVYADDDGGADQELEAALTAFAALTDETEHDPARLRVLCAMAEARVLVPVVALTDETSAHMAAVTITGRDGRRGLLAFTSTTTLADWNSAARPVPVSVPMAAQSALNEGASALVLDLAGPAMFPVEHTELTAFAAGWRPVDTGGATVEWAAPLTAGPRVPNGEPRTR